jgi:prophage maintenance system killer protein
MIKNHPFVDGNKRCGAFAFIFFLQQTKVFDLSKINYQTLSVIALLVAESDPKNKDLMIQVIIHTVLTLLIKI